MVESELNKILLESPNPFGGVIARSAWDESPDVESINGNLTRQVLELLKEVKDNRYTKIMLVQGQPGIGKTHFISRLRRLSNNKDFLFVAIKPISSTTSTFSHIYREIFTSLRFKSNEKYNPMQKLLGQIISSSLAKALREKRKSAQLPMRLQELIEKLEGDSTLILELIEHDPNTINNLQPVINTAIKNIEQEHPDVDITFLKVLFKTLDKELQNDAMRWLQGDDIDDDVLERIKVRESISDESVAQRVLHSIMTLSNQSLLLCFDQLESIYDRFHDPSVIVTFFDTLVRISNETPNALILLMIQTVVWDQQLRPQIQTSAMDRIEYIDSIQVPNYDEMVEIITRRMNTIWDMSTNQPPTRIYPFTENYIKSVSELVGWNPRSVLKQLSAELHQMKRVNTVHILDNFSVSQQNDTKLEVEQDKDVNASEFLHNQLKRIITQYKETITEESFLTKEEYLEAGFFDLFQGMKDCNSTVNNIKLIDVIFKKKDKEIDIILKVTKNDSDTDIWGVEICNNERGVSFNNVLKMIQRNLNQNIINKWIIIRDENLPVKTSWKKSIELLETLSDRGEIMYIDSEDNISLYACKELLNMSSAGDLEFNGNTIARKEVIPHLIEKIIPETTIMNTIFGIHLENVESKKKKTKKFDKDQIKQEIIKQTDTAMMVCINKFFKNFQEHREAYIEVINELVKENQIIVLGSMEKQIVVSKPLSEDVF